MIGTTKKGQQNSYADDLKQKSTVLNFFGYSLHQKKKIQNKKQLLKKLI